MNKNKNVRGTFIYILTLCYMLPLSVILTVNMFSSMFQTTYMELYLDTEKPSYKADSPVILILLTLIFIVICGIYLKKHKADESTAAAFEKAALIFSAVLCLFIILLFRVGIASDSQSVSNVAVEFLNGKYRTFFDNNYLFRYSHQLSMVVYFELIYYIFGVENFIVLQVINVISIVSVIYFLHRITKEMFDNYEIQVMLSILCIGMLPLYLYASFIYGDVPGMGFGVPAVYFVMKYLRTRKKLLILPAVFCISFSILLKSNNFVILAAIVITLVLHSVEKKDWYALIFAAVLLLGPNIFTDCINAEYAKEAGITKIPDGTPKLAWVAMGLQENDYIENGWFNNYNCAVYEACDFDTDRANAACIDSIKQSLQSFISSPRNGVRFFYRKFVSQWNDPGFQSQLNIEWNSRHSENKSSLAQYFIYENGRMILEELMNIYHFIILLGAVLFGMFNLRKTSRSSALLALCVFGGYFFHMFWEAKGRYGLEYFVMCVPMAAFGVWKMAIILPVMLKNLYIKVAKTLA